MKRSKKLDIIIYLSLFVALVCIGMSALDYSHAFKSEKDITEPLVEEKKIEEPTVPEPVVPLKDEEPEELIAVDKKTIVKTYLDQVLDQIVKDQVITYKMIKTWSTYEVLNTTYVRKIVDGYFEYLVDIKIPNIKATLPCKENAELSTKEYKVITLTINILNENKTNNYIVKSINKPNTENN